MKNFAKGFILATLLWFSTLFVFAQGLSYRAVKWGDVPPNMVSSMDKFNTTMWNENDTVLILEYDYRRFALNVDKVQVVRLKKGAVDL